MSRQLSIDTLRGIKFLSDISDDELEHLAEGCREVEFRNRETIFSEHDRSSQVYYVVSGKVSLVVCVPSVGCRQIMTASDGDFLGWTPILEGARMTATAQTLAPTKLITIDASKIIELCDHNAQFGYKFMRRTAQALADRLFATRLQLLELGGHHLPEVYIESD